MKSKAKGGGGLVYSSEQGKMCGGCGKALSQCTCKQTTSAPAGDGVVRVGRQTKGRKGKGVTVITGVPLGASELGKLAKELKKKCGCGGAVKDGTIEIQGDKREVLVEELQARGWTVKRSGG